jgi:uncharacterized protein YecT (DUF1311 family)
MQQRVEITSGASEQFVKKGRYMSSLRLVWIVAACLLSASSFAAPQLASTDWAAITQCVGALHDNHDYGETSCAGLIPNPCIKAANSRDPHVSDANACAGRELRVWEERLGTSLKIMNANFPALQSALAGAQAVWLKSREEVCPKLNVEETNDRSDYCRLQETSRRALIIECLSLSHTKNGSAEACIGSLAGHCALATGEDAKACAARALSNENRRLQSVVKDVGGIEKSQAIWLESRETLCPLFDTIDPGTDHVGSDRCRQAETRGRAEILEGLVEMNSG